MKKWLCILLAAALVLSLCACSGGVKEEEPPAKEPDLPPVPPLQKTVSLKDYDAITVHSTTTVEDGLQLKTVRAMERRGEETVYYQKITQISGDMTQEVEHLCIVTGDTVQTYVGQYGEYQKTEPIFLDFERDDQYFTYCFAMMGFNYGAHLQVTALTPGEDETVNGRDCYTYTITYTDPLQLAYQSTLWVEKATGLWLREEFANEQTTGVNEITEVVYDATVIPDVTE